MLYAFIGCILGTLIGVLPGLGPAAGTAILIPITFNLDPIGAIIMLAAIYYGAMYGGTEELDHNFLWRYQRHLPERGR